MAEELKQRVYELRIKGLTISEIRKELRCNMSKAAKLVREVDAELYKQKADEIVKLYKEGYTIKEICEKVGWGKHRVTRILKASGLLTRKRCQYEGETLKQMVIKLNKEGYTIEEIARILRCRETKVSKIVKEMGLPRWQRRGRNYLNDTIKIPSSEWKLGYIAGLLDGEGTITIWRKQPYCSITNTSKEVMEWLANNLGGTIYKPKRREKATKDIYLWSLSRTKDIAKLLRILLPYLIIKRREAEKVIALCEEKRVFDPNNPPYPISYFKN